jgi:hypothetical protein
MCNRVVTPLRADADDMSWRSNSPMGTFAAVTKDRYGVRHSQKCMKVCATTTASNT